MKHTNFPEEVELHENDWYIIPSAIVAAVVIAVPLFISIWGTDSFIETAGSIIDSWVN